MAFQSLFDVLCSPFWNAEKYIDFFFTIFGHFSENFNSWPENEIFKGIHFRSESVEFSSSHCQKVTKMECLDEIMG